MTLNILPSLPGLSWKKKAPAPLLAKYSQMVTNNRIGLMQINAISEIKKSKNLLKKCLYIEVLKLIYALHTFSNTSATCADRITLSYTSIDSFLAFSPHFFNRTLSSFTFNNLSASSSGLSGST